MKQRKKYDKIYLAAPAVALADGLITTAQAVATIGEIAIKGLANTFLSLFSRDFYANYGLLQLLLALPLFTFLALPSIFINTIKVAVDFFIDPNQASIREERGMPRQFDRGLCQTSF